MSDSWKQSIHAFLEKAGSASPTPGGGSVAALAAALGASMGSMVTRLTTGNKYEDVQVDMSFITGQMAGAVSACEAVMLEDIESFGEFMRVLALPRTTEEERELRKKALSGAAVRAAEVPLGLMVLCHELLLLLHDAVMKVNRNVISDWGIAALMLEAAIQSAWLTVEINLSSIQDLAAAARIREQGEAFELAGAKLKAEILTAVRSRL
ncbi:cyclodeaminase/cyclohydrolase family protein [Paenibacillus sepulcri]